MVPEFLDEAEVGILRGGPEELIPPPSNELLQRVRSFGLVTAHQVYLPNHGGKRSTGDNRRRMRCASMGDEAMVVGAYMLHLAVLRGLIPLGYVFRDTSVIVSYPRCAYQPWRYELPEGSRHDSAGHLYYSAFFFVDCGNLQVQFAEGPRLIKFQEGDIAVLGAGALYSGAGYGGDDSHVVVHTYFAWSGPGVLPRFTFHNKSVAIDAEEDARLSLEAQMVGSISSSDFE